MRTRRKWKTQEAVDKAESRLHHRALVGSVAIGQVGLGSISTTSYSNLKGKQKHNLVQRKVRAGTEEERTSQMV